MPVNLCKHTNLTDVNRTKTKLEKLCIAHGMRDVHRTLCAQNGAWWNDTRKTVFLPYLYRIFV